MQGMVRSAWLWLGLCALVLLAGCARTPAEAQVRAAIDAGVSAVRENAVGDFSDLLSASFVGNAGQADKAALVNLLRLARLRRESIKVLPGPVSLERRGDRFVAAFSVTLSGGRGWLPRHPTVYRVTSGWREEGGQWRCYSASWERALG